MNNSKAVVLFSTPYPVNGSRQADIPAMLSADDIEALDTAMFDDLVEAVVQLDATDIIVYRDGKEFSEEFKTKFLKRVKCRASQGRTLSEQVGFAMESMAGDTYERVIFLIAHHPLLDKRFFLRVIDQMAYEDNCVVLGSTDEGECFLIGMTASQKRLFQSFSEDLLQASALLEHLCSTDAIVFPTQQYQSLNSLANLIALKEKAGARRALHSDYPRRTLSKLSSLSLVRGSRKVTR